MSRKGLPVIHATEKVRIIMNFSKGAFICLFLFCLSTGGVHAAGPLSPVEAKYQAEYPALFEKYSKAVTLIESPGRNPAGLKEANVLLGEIIKANLNFAPAYVAYARLTFLLGFDPGQLSNNLRPSYAEGTTDRVQAAARQALNLEPSYADAYLPIAFAHIYWGEFEQARQALQMADALGSKSPWLYLYNAKILFGERKYDAAKLLYQFVLDQEVTDKSAYHHALFELANSYRFSRGYDEAEVWYLKAIDYAPRPSHLNTYASFLIYIRTDFDKAIEVGRRSMELETTYFTNFITGIAYYAKASTIEAESGEYAAQPYLDTATEIFPEMLTAMSQLGNHRNTRHLSWFLDRKIRKTIENARSRKQT